MSKNDGGPAFQANHFDLADNEHGMTLRDYFIAHAPAEPQPWFKPTLSPRPVPLYVSDDKTFKSFSWSEMERRFGDCYGMENQPEVSAWEADSVKQRYVQWPAAWADAMLAERSK